MLEERFLPSWPEIFRRPGESELRRSWARCPIHDSHNPTDPAMGRPSTPSIAAQGIPGHTKSSWDLTAALGVSHKGVAYD